MCETTQTIHSIKELGIGDLVKDQKSGTSYIVIYRSYTLSDDFMTAICMEQVTFWKILAENQNGEIEISLDDISGIQNIIELNTRNCCFYSKILGTGYKKFIKVQGKITMKK